MPQDYNKYHTHHQSRRLAQWDYDRSAAYFVTICTQDRVGIFGEIVCARMYLNDYGRIAVEEWQRTPDVRTEIVLDAFVVMPNPIHGIVVIMPSASDAPPDPQGYNVFTENPRSVDRRSTPSNRRSTPSNHRPKPSNRRSTPSRRSTQSDQTILPSRSGLPNGPLPGSLGAVIAGFKSAVSGRINRLRNTSGRSVWQRGYWDRIIRNETEWERIRNYIQSNPAKWPKDRMYWGSGEGVNEKEKV